MPTTPKTADAMIEAAAQAVFAVGNPSLRWEDFPDARTRDRYRNYARAALLAAGVDVAAKAKESLGNRLANRSFAPFQIRGNHSVKFTEEQLQLIHRIVSKDIDAVAAAVRAAAAKVAEKQHPHDITYFGDIAHAIRRMELDEVEVSNG